MNHSNDSSTKLLDRTPSQAVFRKDVITGLSADEKSLPCKYFYDRRGSQLFERICELDEYYLTRTELQILRDNADAIADVIGPGVTLIEPGSGSSIKTRILLDHLREPVGYMPIDISRAHLLQAVNRLTDRYPDLPVNPVSADFTRPFELPPTAGSSRRCVFFPGSTIGNFAEDAADDLLKRIAAMCGAGGGLLIGIDLKKDAAVLQAAYDDSRGVTAEFNRNLLRRINRELNADFDVDRFRHKVVYRPGPGRIEISLVSQCEQVVNVGGRTFRFAAGEEIRTEHCHKYDVEQFTRRAERAGFQLARHWTDARDYFAVLYLRTAGIVPDSENPAPKNK